MQLELLTDLIFIEIAELAAEANALAAAGDEDGITFNVYADYDAEVEGWDVVVRNDDDGDFWVEPGMKIAEVKELAASVVAQITN